jgi:hypothetical protein
LKFFAVLSELVTRTVAHLSLKCRKEAKYFLKDASMSASCISWISFWIAASSAWLNPLNKFDCHLERISGSMGNATGHSPDFFGIA